MEQGVYTPKSTVFNALYLVADWPQQVAKFGITSNLPQRLDQHAKGSEARPFQLTHVIAVAENLPEGKPKQVEDAIKAQLRRLGAAIAGTEYYTVDYIDDMLNVCRHHGLVVPTFAIK